MRRRNRFRLVLVALAATGLVATATPAGAATSRTVHLDLASGQQPENLTLEPDGAADLTFAYTGEIGRVTPGGHVTVIGRIPVPGDGDIPVVHRKLFLGGIVRARWGDLYVAASTGLAGSTGVYRLRPGGTAVRVAALPASGFHNGMAVDPDTGELYVADSYESTVWRVSPRTGAVTAWAAGELLAPRDGFGANGIKVHGGAVWVSNIGQHTLVRFPLRCDGAAGAGKVVASGLGPVDDFAFHGDTVVAAINQDDRVSVIAPDGSSRTVLTAADGLDNPTSTAVRGDTLYITDAAYFTGTDPNLLVTSTALR
jgi:sugar lactone lactonase YvrE